MNRFVPFHAVVLVAIAIARFAPAASAAEPPPTNSAPLRVSYHRQVSPILQAQCAGCHQPAKAKGGFILTDHARLLVAGESGKPPINTNQVAASHLLEQIRPTDGKAEMPPGKPPLAETDIHLIERWIAEGAVDDTPPNARPVYDLHHPPRYSRPPAITSIDFSPDGAWLAVAGHHEILLHHSDGSGLAARLIGLSERIQSVRFSPDGKFLAAAGGQPARLGEIQIWDVEKRELKTSVTVGHDTVYGVSWSPDGRWIAFGCPDKTVRAIEAASGKQILHQMAHEDWVLDTVFSSNGTHVISVGRDMTAKLTEVATQRFIDNITSITPGALRGGLLGVARHPSRDEILVGGSDGQPQVFQVFRQAARKIGDNATLLRRFPEMEGRVFGVDYSPDGNLVAACASLDSRGGVNLYAAKFDPVIPDALLKAYQKTSGEYSAEEREAIQRFTTADVRLLHQLKIGTAPVYAIRFSPDGRRVAAGTGAGNILMIGVESGVIEMVFAAAPLEDDPSNPTSPPLSPPAPTLAGKAAPSTEEVPPANAVTRLAVVPDRVRFTSRNERIQLLVTASNDAGESFDVTRHSQYTRPSDATVEIAVSAHGLLTLHPTAAPGALPNSAQPVPSLGITFGGKTVEVPLEVDLSHSTFDADFVRDVNPVLSKLGCSAGTCHGSREGKAGFKMSLRGYDPVFDVRGLTDDLAARRVNLASPDESLMLLKATGAVPHEGGQRTPPGSDHYQILRQWIADGARLDLNSPKVAGITLMPQNPVVQKVGSRQQIRVVATYTDGTTRDVTTDAFVESGNADVATADAAGLITTLRRGEAPILARYEGSYAATTVTVMGDRSGFAWSDPPANNRIDELVAAKWRRLKILPSDLCSDADFIRRVSLDLTGLPPTAQEVREFLGNPRDRRSKRDALVEKLLNSQDYVDHWANKWADLLQVNRKFLGEEGAKLFREWIRREIAANTPYDQFVRRLLEATGSNKDNPPASYWKILREPTEAMETTTHLFLATRFNCNKCHDHPFERWTQDQYYHLAQFFAQVRLSKDDASGDRRIGGSAVEGSKPLFEIVADQPEGGVKHDRTGKIVTASFPFTAATNHFTTPTTATNAPRRAQLAAWLTSTDNRYFASSYVNRLWGYLLGVGLVEPLDDIRAGNPPTNPELLEHLTREFVESGFNTRHILRQICQSRVYQLSLTTHRWNSDDTQNYSHALPRRLPAEVLLDAVYRVTGTLPSFPGASPGTRAAQLVDSAVDLPSGFLANLGRPPRESACECERSNDIKLSSVMALLSGPAVSDAVRDPENALGQLARSESDDRKLADELFVRVLNRPASDLEKAAVVEHAAGLELAHTRLTQELAKAEAAWAQRKPSLDRERSEAINRAEKALSDYLAERAPKIAAAQRHRLDRIADAEAKVAEQEPALRRLTESWEASLDAKRRGTDWVALDPKDLAVGGSARLQKLADGSVRSVASVGELPNYTVTAETQLTGITGFKLEVLPDANLPAFGPGHKDGDFVLAEVVVETAPRTNQQNYTRAPIARGAADSAAEGLDAAQLFNGIREQGRRDGWGIGKATGRPHWAAFAFDKPVGDTNGVAFRFTLVHSYEAPYEVGRFRLWVTTSPNPTDEGLPADLRPILDTPAHRRNGKQTERLLQFVRAADPDALQRDFHLELARQPLPADHRLAELERDLARASRPVPIDPALLQLREDVQASSRQLAEKRVTATQDVAWALINTPAFLFNR
ncbi:MAG: DUF1549 domain-containing protein [Verrucomicrobiales bacterium]|nr:DUF1549 domain-containing protein [Verrucomicrobiales bacterium]